MGVVVCREFGDAEVDEKGFSEMGRSDGSWKKRESVMYSCFIHGCRK
jgi:hypothetical protein